MKVHKINEYLPELQSIGINLNEGPQSVAAARKYMAGSYIPKSCKIKGLTTRRITTGFERQYGKAARRIEAPSNMTVVKMFYRKSVQQNENIADDWEALNVVFYNEDKHQYDLLVLPKYNTQNHKAGFEFKYDKSMIRRLQPNATFAKGEIFALSPGMADSGEWMFGIDLLVAPMTIPPTEEDGIVLVRSTLEKLGIMFEHNRNYSWNDSEYIPLNLYGDENNYKPFPENGERVRPDGLVMAFRRRDSKSAMVALTDKALMRVDYTFDVKRYAPPGAVVKHIQVRSERLKNRSNNKKEREIQTHTQLLEQYQSAENEMCNQVISWYYSLTRKYNKDADLPMTNALKRFVLDAFGNRTRDASDSNRSNMVKRTNRNKQLLDWNVEISLKEDVKGKIRFKLSDLSGGKGVIVHVIEDEFAPIDAWGRRAEAIVNNTPTFRRQIMTSLISQHINFVNITIESRIREMIKEKDGYKRAYALLRRFYHSVSPEFGKLTDEAFVTNEDRAEHIDYVLRTHIAVERRSNSEVYGLEITRRLLKEFMDVQGKPITYYNELNEPVETIHPVYMTYVHYLLLDKFGSEQSSESLPKRNLFGFPTKLNNSDRFSKWYRAQLDRNSGATEERIEVSQVGAEEAARMLALSYSPEASHMMVRRIIRAENPFHVPEVIKPEECGTNRALLLANNYLTDAGWCLRAEKESDIVLEDFMTGGTVND